MDQEINKPIDIKDLPDSNLDELSCPYCKSNNLKISHSRLRTIADLGTKKIRIFLRFESIHIECKTCGEIFYYQRDGIIPGLSVSKEVLDTVLSHYYDFGDSIEEIIRRMEAYYSVKLKSGKIKRWIRIYGEKYCQRNKSAYKENLEDFSGHLSIDGTFPKLCLEKGDELPNLPFKKKRVHSLRLTTLKDKTLCAVWEEERIK